MGKGPKHNNNKSRSNGIFKVAGQNFKTEKKGKPKEVTSKLKLVRKINSCSMVSLHIFNIFQISRKNKEKVCDLDDKMKQLQEASVKSGKSFSGEEKKPKQIISKKRSDTVEEHEMEDLAESLLKQ